MKLGEVGDVLGRSDGKVLPQQLLDVRQVRNAGWRSFEGSSLARLVGQYAMVSFASPTS